ncbi:MAG: hypothetical protein HWE26_06985 [Alteromonadaceae bacterium]|nr:hypothetical protein [Alteromonadaceae bacterium]
MHNLNKKLTIIAMAATLIGGGISSVAIAADSHKENAANHTSHPEKLLPRGMAKAMEELALTDAQKEQLKAIKAKREALKDEFWAVFTEEQKTSMLKKMTQHRKAMHRKDKWDKPHRKHDNSDDRR